MKRFLLFLTFVCVLLTLVGCNWSEDVSIPKSISIMESDITVPVGDSFQLSVFDEKGNNISSDKLLWKSSVPNVASVSPNGCVDVKHSGLTEITAVLSDDWDVSTSVNVFCPYQTQEFSESEFIVEKKEVGNEHLKGVLGYIWDTTKFIIDADSLGVMDVFPSFFAKDEYMFSYVIDMGHADNYVICDLTGWVDGTVSFNKNITSDTIYKQLSGKLNKILGIEDTLKGQSFDYYFMQIESLISKIKPEDGKFHFSKMDKNYHYRVVLKADIDYYDTVSYYQNGLIIANVELIKGLIEEGLDGFNGDAGLYCTETVDIVNVENMYVCIERRLKNMGE